MKKAFLFIMSFIVGLMSITFVQAKNDLPKIFNPDDMVLIGVKIDTTIDEVVKILGTPQKIESRYEEAFDENILFYYYDCGKIRLEPYDDGKYNVASIYTDKSNLKGPRNINVGDHINDVLVKFPYDKNDIIEEKGDTQIKYVYGRLYNSQYEVDGNNGLIKYDKQGKVIAITYSYDYYTLYMEVKNNLIKSITLTAHNN